MSSKNTTAGAYSCRHQPQKGSQLREDRGHGQLARVVTSPKGFATRGRRLTRRGSPPPRSSSAQKGSQLFGERDEIGVGVGPHQPRRVRNIVSNQLSPGTAGVVISLERFATALAGV